MTSTQPERMDCLPKRQVIFVRAPLRVSFFGGSSDLPGFYRSHPGTVMTAAVDRFIDVTVRMRTDNNIRVITNSLEVVDDPSRVSNPIIRAALATAQPRVGFDLVVTSDVTRAGSGMGASSALVVAILRAFECLHGAESVPESLASAATRCEMVIAGRGVGKQDAYPAVFGGLRRVDFQADETVIVGAARHEPVIDRLSSMLLITDTGRRRDAAAVLAQQSIRLSADERFPLIRSLVDLAEQFDRQLRADSIADLPEMLGRAWDLKRRLIGWREQDDVEHIYRRGLAAGAIGAKLLGAGSGGHLLWVAPPHRHADVAAVLPEFKTSSLRIVGRGVRADVLGGSEGA